MAKGKQVTTIEAEVQRFMLATANTLEDIAREAAALLPALLASEAYKRADAASEAGDDDAAAECLAFYLSGTLADQLGGSGKATSELGELIQQLRREGTTTERKLRAENAKHRSEHQAFLAREAKAEPEPTMRDLLHRLGDMFAAYGEALTPPTNEKAVEHVRGTLRQLAAEPLFKRPQVAA